MKICIDARWIIAESSGISRYTINLIRYLLAADQENHYLLIFKNAEIRQQVLSEIGIQENERICAQIFSSSPFSMKSQWQLAFRLKKRKIDIFHSTHFMIPIVLLGIKSIVTIHDLIPFLFPHFAPRSKKSRFYAVYRLLMKMIVRRAHHIVVDSENSLRDLIKYFKGASSKTSVVTFGADPSFFKKIDLNIKDKLKIQGRVLLYVGRQDPYKNILGLLDIFHPLRKKYPDVYLVVAGPQDSRYPEVQEKIKSMDLLHCVIMTGYLDQRELVSLYRESFCLLLPSFYEGFGLPILEAFACGIPVIASRVASIPEVAGEAGILLDPNQGDLWVDAVSNLLDHQQEWKNRVLRGNEQLKVFSWERTVRDMLAIYQRVYEGRDRT